MRGSLYLIVVFLIIGVTSSAAHAQCTNPAGVAGEEFYNSSEKVFQYCNGDDWVAMICNNEPDIEPAECSLPWGGTILHNANVTAYQNATEPFGGSCTSESRTCNNGALSGSYVNQNCSVSPPADCTAPWGATVSHGSDVLAYQNATEPFGGSCMSESRTCNNGALGGSFTNQNCTISPATCALPWGGSINHGQSRIAYSFEIAPNISAHCSSASTTRTCDNGTLTGSSSYVYESCRDCYFLHNHSGTASGQYILTPRAAGENSSVSINWTDVVGAFEIIIDRDGTIIPLPITSSGFYLFSVNPSGTYSISINSSDPNSQARIAIGKDGGISCWIL